MNPDQQAYRWINLVGHSHKIRIVYVITKIVLISRRSVECLNNVGLAIITVDNHVTCGQKGNRMWFRFRPAIDKFVDRFKVSGHFDLAFLYFFFASFAHY